MRRLAPERLAIASMPAPANPRAENSTVAAARMLASAGVDWPDAAAQAREQRVLTVLLRGDALGDQGKDGVLGIGQVHG